ncbi:MAG: nucleoside-diphosphate kinase [Chitinophagales bacterium]|nr:nucleoside-diphosphate kinase [Chitinophagales bacterium]MDW8427444.1 nucleoside-diphosphate kinase [Chitinophagales bacterium]
MANSFTLTIIKPDAVAAGHIGNILQMICQAGFRIVAMKMVHMSESEAGRFYAVHRERPFYRDLVRFMSSGPVVAAIIDAENAVERFRQLIGATNPEQAAEGTVRRLYGTSVERNAVHGSDSDANAVTEAAFFFSELERFTY